MKFQPFMISAVLLASPALAQQDNPDPVRARPPGAPASQPAAPGEAGSKPAEPRTDTSITTGTVHCAATASAPERDIPYTATAGYMPLKDDREKLRANIFYTAYTLGSHPPTTSSAAGPAPSTTQPVPSDPTRPITFVFNGGPGAASAWLHLGTVGPRRIDIPADGTAPTAPFHLVENNHSWFAATDLVCVDPVNTGYSRAATPEQAKEFFGVQEDISAMGEFIRLYMTKNQRWGSPVFLAGESYGTTRAAGLSDYLQERLGISPSGIILISTVLNFAALSPGENNDLPYALYLPSYAAISWYHKKAGVGKDLDPLIDDAETFVVNEYIPALAKGSALAPADRDHIASRLAELTGLPKPYILESNLRISPAHFEKELLRSPTGEGSRIIGRFDGRLVGFPTDATANRQEYDPSLSGFYTAYTSSFNIYVRQKLKFDSDLPYEVLSPRVGPWNFGGGGSEGYLYVGDNLRDAMTHNPRLKLLVCSGHFDLATPFFATDYQLAHMTLAPDIRKNITQTYYAGGHMLYHVHTELEKLYRDVTTFIDKSK
jgi:carboxypeptidase C (cathepsin A)